MIILGIDPGLARTGWAIIKKLQKEELIDYGCIETEKNIENIKRLDQIYRRMGKIIDKFKPRVMCLENIFFNTNAKTAFLIGEARGVIKACASQQKLSVREFTPLQIKEAIAGYGRADKNQVQQMIKVLLQLKAIPKPDDAADAIAVALTYCCHHPPQQGKILP